jgi:hypothetical protein
MPQLSGKTTRGVAVAVLSVAGMAGVFALWSASSASTAEMTPAQTVAYRFPMNWGSAAAPKATPAPRQAAPVVDDERTALANLMFSPAPAYGLASAPADTAGSTEGYGLASASSRPVTLPERANAYADPSADGAKDSPRPAAKPRAEKHPAAPPKQSNNVLNDGQIASIKTRLKLTPDQQRQWPAVEAALRNITYKKDSKGSKLQTVDPNSPAVQELKSAAVPLIMSFSEAQKDEVRQLARLMGLEQVASAF